MVNIPIFEFLVFFSGCCFTDSSFYCNKEGNQPDASEWEVRHVNGVALCGFKGQKHVLLSDK